MDDRLIWPGADVAPSEQLAEYETPWLTMVTCIFERLPVLSPEPPQWEVEYQAYQDGMAQLLHQRAIATDPLMRDVSALADYDPNAGDAGESLVGKKEEEASGIVMTRTLPADETGDRRTVGRALTERLYLLLKARDVLQRDRVMWQLPTMPYRASSKKQEAESLAAGPITMRQTIETGLAAYMGTEVDAFPVGYAPSAHLCFELPSVQRGTHNSFGKKVFFYRVQYLGGNITLNRKRVADFAWVTKAEMGDYFPRDTARRIKAILH